MPPSSRPSRKSNARPQNKLSHDAKELQKRVRKVLRASRTASPAPSPTPPWEGTAASEPHAPESPEATPEAAPTAAPEPNPEVSRVLSGVSVEGNRFSFDITNKSASLAGAFVGVVGFILNGGLSAPKKNKPPTAPTAPTENLGGDLVGVVEEMAKETQGEVASEIQRERYRLAWALRRAEANSRMVTVRLRQSPMVLRYLIPPTNLEAHAHKCLVRRLLDESALPGQYEWHLPLGSGSEAEVRGTVTVPNVLLQATQEEEAEIEREIKFCLGLTEAFSSPEDAYVTVKVKETPEVTCHVAPPIRDFADGYVSLRRALLAIGYGGGIYEWKISGPSGSVGKILVLSTHAPATVESSAPPSASSSHESEAMEGIVLNALHFERGVSELPPGHRAYITLESTTSMDRPAHYTVCFDQLDKPTLGGLTRRLLALGAPPGTYLWTLYVSRLVPHPETKTVGHVTVPTSSTEPTDPDRLALCARRYGKARAQAGVDSSLWIFSRGIEIKRWSPAPVSYGDVLALAGAPGAREACTWRLAAVGTDRLWEGDLEFPAESSKIAAEDSAPVEASPAGESEEAMEQAFGQALSILSKLTDMARLSIQPINAQGSAMQCSVVSKRISPAHYSWGQLLSECQNEDGSRLAHELRVAGLPSGRVGLPLVPGPYRWELRTIASDNIACGRFIVPPQSSSSAPSEEAIFEAAMDACRQRSRWNTTLQIRTIPENGQGDGQILSQVIIMICEFEFETMQSIPRTAGGPAERGQPLSPGRYRWSLDQGRYAGIVTVHERAAQ